MLNETIKKVRTVSKFVVNHGGTWHLRLVYEVDGIVCQKGKSTGLKARGNKKAAESMLPAFEAEVLSQYTEPAVPAVQGVELETAGQELFGEYMKKWLENMQTQVAPSTYSGYRRVVKVIAEYFNAEGVTLQALRPLDIEKFYAVLAKRGVTNNTILHAHANIHKALKTAVRYELIAENPADKIERPRREQFRGKYLSEEEVKKLLKAAEGDSCEVCILLAAYYGLRRSEVIGLQWHSIDFTNNTLTIEHKVTSAINDDGHGYEYSSDSLKNKQSYRVLPLMPKVKTFLLEEQKKQLMYRTVLGDKYLDADSDYVCRLCSGKRIPLDLFYHHFKAILKQADLRSIRLHDLRHTSASLMLRQGVGMKQVQEWLGHSNFSTTADIYAHLDYTAKEQTALALQSALG